MRLTNRIKLLIKVSIFGIIFCLLIACGKKKQPLNNELRIISLAPNITEILYELNLEENIVAVSDYCLYPAKVAEKPSVGGLFNPDLERIAALRPGLILATESNVTLPDKITNSHIKVVLLPEKTLADLYKSIQIIGELTSREPKAAQVVQSIKDSLASYNKKAINPPSAILVLGRENGSTRNIGISGPGGFINELWEMAGGVNAFADMPGSFTQVNREDLLKRNPQIVIEFKTEKNWDDTRTEKNIMEWNELAINAVKSKNVYVVNGISFLIPGPRIHLLAKAYSDILRNFNSKTE